jgi:hypothetical protein
MEGGGWGTRGEKWSSAQACQIFLSNNKPKQEEKYPMTTKTPKGHKIYQTVIK